MVFQQKLFEKSMFHRQNDLSSYGPVSQFWPLKGVLSKKKILCTFLRLLSKQQLCFVLPDFFKQEISLTLLSLYLRPKVNI